MRKNGGFSLVELITTVAIMSVLLGVMASLLGAGVNFWRKHSAAVSIQMESQVVMAQIREYVVDSTECSADGRTTLIAARETDTGKLIHEFVYDGVSTVNYTLTTATYGVGGTADTTTTEGPFPIAENVKNFVPIRDINSVSVHLEFDKLGASWEEDQIIALRNR